MKPLRILTAATACLVTGLPAAPGPDSPNNGLAIIHDTTSGQFIMEWWASSPRFYFIEASENLVDWKLIPAFVPGTNSAAEAGFKSNAPRLFFRLAHTDDVESALMQADYDVDGLTTHQEYLLGTAPFIPDTSGDGIFDGIAAKLGTPLAPPTSPTPYPADTAPPIISLHQPIDAVQLP